MKSPQTRMTRQRKIILEELRKVVSHPTAEEIHVMVRTRLPRISLGTVYRNLDFLAATGEIRQLQSGGAVRRFDGNIAQHCHVRCRACGKVGDVYLSEGGPPDIAAVKAAAPGFFITGSSLEFEGFCSDCAQG